MANLTITVDDEALRRARIRALEQGTSVNAVLRDYLEAYAGGDDLSGLWDRVFLLADSAGASSDDEGRAWTRDELYRRG